MPQLLWVAFVSLVAFVVFEIGIIVLARLQTVVGLRQCKFRQSMLAKQF